MVGNYNENNLNSFLSRVSNLSQSRNDSKVVSQGIPMDFPIYS